MKSSIVSLALACAAVVSFASSSRAADRRSVGAVSFALPDGWTYTLPEGLDYAALRHVDQQAHRYCMVSVYAPRAAGKDLDTDFEAEWKALATPVGTAKGPAQPKPSHRTVAGVQIAEGRANTIASPNMAILEQVVVALRDGQIVTLVVWTPDASAAAAYAGKIDALLSSLELAPAKPAVSSGGKPAGGPPGTALANVGVADLVGTWDATGGSVNDWYDSSGQFKATSVAFYGESHTFAADGSFTYSFVGRSDNHTVKEGDSGTVAFKDGFLVLTYKHRSEKVRERRVIGFVTTPDGTSIMVTVDAHTTQTEVHWTDPAYLAEYCGNPIGGAYTNCVGGETWVRRHK